MKSSAALARQVATNEEPADSASARRLARSRLRLERVAEAIVDRAQRVEETVGQYMTPPSGIPAVKEG
jgi:hypothetical protein